jgi:P27 family predicted phage terminase small subunit
LKPNDLGGLVMLCEIWAIRQAALEQLAREGLTIEAPQGALRHPAVGIAATAWKEYRAWAAHFGLTPAAEGRISKPKEPGDDEDNPFA